ncbi:MAG: hypothetical protein U1U88_001383 [Lawsonella clevelandensis]
MKLLLWEANSRQASEDNLENTTARPASKSQLVEKGARFAAMRDDDRHPGPQEQAPPALALPATPLIRPAADTAGKAEVDYAPQTGAATPRRDSDRAVASATHGLTPPPPDSS